MAQTAFPRLLKRGDVEDLTGLSRSTIYRKMRAGEFPEPLSLGGGAVRWREDELREWIESRPRASGEA